MRIINLTQHEATPDQIAAGVVEPSSSAKERIKKLLTFDELPSLDELFNRSYKLAEFAETYTYAMIGGAPYLMRNLELALEEAGVTPCYAFSVRRSEEITLPNGAVEKKVVFRHLGFFFIE